MRDDTVTRTEADAGLYEQNRASDRWAGSERPSLAECEADEALDRLWRAQEARLDEARRARGEWVPTARTRTEGMVIALALGQAGLFVTDVVPVKDDVFRVDGVTGTEHSAWTRLRPNMYEIRVRDGVVWIKSQRMDEGPPF